MSATLAKERLCDYLNAVSTDIPGRTFPVSIRYLAEEDPEYLDAALETVYQIHTSQPAGDILVFLTGEAEIVILRRLGAAVKTVASVFPNSCARSVFDDE